MSSHEAPRLDLPGFDTLIDLVGDPGDADLYLFLNGNQFMVMPELLTAFRARHPQFSRIYYETLPPGLLAHQIQAEGRIHIGSLILTVYPDVFTAGRGEMDLLKEEVLEPLPYAENRLALVVQPKNPKQIAGFQDLAREDIRVAMPNPETEGIARLARHALDLVGGESLANAVFRHKQDLGTTLLTTVHHRETVDWIERDRVDVGVVWQSEAAWARATHRRVESIPLDDFLENPVGQYFVAGLKRAPHPEARDAYLTFLQTSEAQAIYARYGFMPPEAHSTVFSGF
ncbi:molybdate ABC transporter substrate-binding protein [Sulfobacillus harzensis]|uniref:ABC transporter substrate-binding protein n=1 Tax=Sulfobacillus harzensis TaxID=2729629 RepID=A0A7Y0Q2G2_9FIRM|nr:substrate-binding domain-containing protein [Sulfobacillus harzensis]NMP21886.1 ABC transporter substrate-binding protein [Sulfobacillus harzensis]